MSLKHLTDLNLLPLFIAVYETGSVQKAAMRLGLTPSATSHALARLRQACQDELFVRLGQGLEPTVVARRIYPEVRRALDAIRLSMQEAVTFDPAMAVRRFHLAIPHPLGPLWALSLDSRMRLATLSVTIQYDTRTLASDPDERLADGIVDLMLDWVPIQLDRFVNRALFEEEAVVIVRQDHPRIQGAPGLKALQAEAFVSCHMRQRLGPSRSLSKELADRGISGRLLVSEFLEVPTVVAESDMLGVVPASMVGLVERRFALRSYPLPFKLDPIPIWLIWHETRRQDPGHAWLRADVAEFVAELVRPPARRAQMPPGP